MTRILIFRHYYDTPKYIFFFLKTLKVTFQVSRRIAKLGKSEHHRNIILDLKATTI